MRILTVYAHPDDESFGPAAALAASVRDGAALSGVWATRGEHGPAISDPPPPPQELAAIRERDLREAAAVIGYRELDFLGYEDGTLAEVPCDRLEEQVYRFIERIRPDMLLTFGPGGITRHPDHLAVWRAASAAFWRARRDGLGIASLFYDAVRPELAAEFGLTSLPDGNPNACIPSADGWPAQLAAMTIHARHMRDAVERLGELRERPQTASVFYRAWPQPPHGAVIRSFALDDEPE